MRQWLGEHGSFVAQMSGTDMACVMRRPPLWSTVRVNTLKRTMEVAKHRMEVILEEQYKTRKREHRPKPTVQFHPSIPDLLLIRGSGPHAVEPVEKEIYVDVDCGCAVMRGADIYAPGILGSNEHFATGDVVSVYLDLDGQCRRGLKQPYGGERVFLGNGVAMVSRSDVFSSSNLDGRSVCGIGVLMSDAIWDNPKLDSAIVEDWGFVQNLPSVVCGHVLDPQLGELVLDMCAAPGGKSTHLATLMGDQGRVVCVDSSANRLQELIKNSKALSLRSIEAHRMNALDLLAAPGPFHAETFDRILLDAPCSCTGQRPYMKKLSEKQRTSHVPQQRKLLAVAYKLLKKGGTMVYSTCSLEIEENERQIAWFLDEYPDMNLAPQVPFVGQDVKVGSHAAPAQKFDPRLSCDNETRSSCNLHPDVRPEGGPTYDQDTIGFFIAKIVKS